MAVFITVGLCYSLLFFFASPKKNQKRSPTKDYGPFVGSSYVQRMYYCSFSIGNSTLCIAIWSLDYCSCEVNQRFCLNKNWVWMKGYPPGLFIYTDCGFGCFLFGCWNVLKCHTNELHAVWIGLGSLNMAVVMNCEIKRILLPCVGRQNGRRRLGLPWFFVSFVSRQKKNKENSWFFSR